MKICFSIYLKQPEALVLCSPASGGDLVPPNTRMGGYELFVGNQLKRERVSKSESLAGEGVSGKMAFFLVFANVEECSQDSTC
jgi:hypothetical protein